MTAPTDEIRGAFDRLPPHDVDAEEAVLGACLVNRNAIGDCIAVVRPEHFFREKNGWIYAAICDLWSRGEDANVVTVAHALAGRDQLEDSGGSVYLNELVRRLPTSEGSSWYAKIVKRDSDYRQLIQASSRIMQEAYAAPEDFDKVLDRGTEALLRLSVQRNRVLTRSVGEVLRGSHDMPALSESIDEFLRDPAGIRGIPTGWDELDFMINGLEPTRVYTVMAGTSAGKSAFVQWTALNVAKLGWPVLLVTTEMSAGEVTERMVYMQAGVDPASIRRTGAPSPAELERIYVAESEVGALPIYICDVGEISLATLTAEAKRQVKLRNVSLVVVDHIQHIRVDGAKGAEELQSVTAGLKGLAMNEYVPLLQVSHVNRDAVKSGIGLSSGKGSGSIEQDTNVLISLTAVKFDIDRWAPMTEQESDEHHAKHGFLYVLARVNKNRAGLKSYSVRRFDWRQGGRFEPLREDGE